MAGERSSLDIETEKELEVGDGDCPMQEDVPKDQATASGNSEASGKRKHKKINRQNSKENVVNTNFIHGPRSWKNSRRSRNGFGRGLPKKGILLFFFI